MIGTQTSTIISPYGGRLVNLVVPGEAADSLKAYAGHLPSIQISPRAACELELLATGALSPLERFMGREDYRRVLEEMRLAGGQVFPLPVTLPVEASPDLHLDRDIALRSSEFELLGVLTVEEIYPWDREEYAARVYGAERMETAARHSHGPELGRLGELNLSGTLQILGLPARRDFPALRISPAQARERLAALGQARAYAYHPAETPPRLDEELLHQAAVEQDGALLLLLAAGLARPGDFVHYHRARMYQRLVERSPWPERVLLALNPTVSQPAGPRAALWQALVSRNYGAGHLILPAGSPDRGPGEQPSEAGAELVTRLSQELGVTLTPEAEQKPAPLNQNGGAPARAFPAAPRHPNAKPQPGAPQDGEFAEILAEMYPPRHRQGVCIWFTGLSGAGKSTTAEILTGLVLEHGRRVTLLDGDVVRTHLSKGLGFSKADRDTNVRRIGFVAAELVRIGGVVICSVVSPYREARGDVRGMVGSARFVEVFVDTPLEVCEARDVKGMYARARQGKLNGFTGIDDPYEPPEAPEITLDTVSHPPQENAARILDYLIRQGFLRPVQSSSLPNESKS